MHAYIMLFLHIIVIEATSRIVCKMGGKKASKTKRNLVSSVEGFVPLSSELRYCFHLYALNAASYPSSPIFYP